LISSRLERGGGNREPSRRQARERDAPPCKPHLRHRYLNAKTHVIRLKFLFLSCPSSGMNMSMYISNTASHRAGPGGCYAYCGQPLPTSPREMSPREAIAAHLEMRHLLGEVMNLPVTRPRPIVGYFCHERQRQASSNMLAGPGIHSEAMSQ